MSTVQKLRTVLVALTFSAIASAGALGAAAEASGTVDIPTVAAGPSSYQGDPAHDGHSTDTSFVAPFTERWTTSLGGNVGYPVIADGRVFTSVQHAPAYGNDVVAMSLATGEVLWGPTSIGGVYWTGSIAHDAGRLFAINGDGLLTAMDATTGEVAWTTQLTGQHSFTSPPTAVAGTVYVGGAGVGGTLYAVDETDGSITWRASVANGDHSSPAVDATGVYVSYACEQTYKFDLSGALLWHHATDCSGGGGRTPVLHDGKVYVRDDSKQPVVLDAATGEVTGSFSARHAPAFDDTHMAAVANGVLTVSEVASGTALWHTSGGDSVTAPLIANGLVVEGLRGGLVEARQVETGALVWRGRTKADLIEPEEQNAWVLTGLGQGEGALVVPAGSTLTAFEPAGDTTTRLTSGPATTGYTGPAATFGFTSDVHHAQYTCTIDGVTGPCTSPVRLSRLATGVHTFSASVAYATAGAAERTFTVDGTAPTARLARFSTTLVSRATVTARWSGTDRQSGVGAYQARTRQAAAGRSLPPWSLRSATAQTSGSFYVRRHERFCVSVRARDRVGNWSAWTAAQCLRRR